MRAERRFDSSFAEVTGWRDGGVFERIPGASKDSKGRLRSAWEARSLAQIPRPDVIWTSAADAASWYACANAGPWRVPIIYDTDASYAQLNDMSRDYYNREPTTGIAFKIRAGIERRLLKQVAIATPWTRWAAKGLIAAGLPPSRVRVAPPGVDLERWFVPKRRMCRHEGPLRLLFVGGDFKRKGGDILLRAVAGPLRGLVELDVVTRDEVLPLEGVTVHRADANSPALVQLFADADVFVMPTKAECFGLATVEALAAGLPVVVGDVGGARDIVVEGKNGWLIEPTVESTTSRIRWLLENREWLGGASVEARRLAQDRFDGRRWSCELANLIVQLAEHRGKP